MSYDTPRFHMPTITPAIKHLLILNGIVFLLNALGGGWLSRPEKGAWLAFSWSGLWEGYGLGLVRIVTYQFTHSFRDIFHVLMNMLVLYFFGTMAERRLGYRGTVKLYLIGGAVGALLHVVIAALQGYADVALVGASGACYGFLVYAACMSPRSMVIFIVFPIQLWILAAGLVVIGLYSTFVEFVDGFPGGVSHGAHLGGAALGFLAHKYSWFVDWADHAGTPRQSWFREIGQRFRQRRAESRERHSQQEQLQLDEILDKVKRDGLQSLSPAERRFLERMSKQAKKGD